MFKKQKKTVQSEPTVYPNGVCVKTELGYFVIKGGKRYHLPTKRIFESWNFPIVVEAKESAVSHYKVAHKIGFRDGTLIYDVSSGRIYLVSDNSRRLIASPEALKKLEASLDTPTPVSKYEANLQRLGEDLN